MEPRTETCKMMEMLIDAGKKVISENDESALRDSALIMGAQKIEHHEIAVYESLCELANALGYDKIGDLLERTLIEEEGADNKLADIAQEVNDEALELSGKLV